MLLRLETARGMRAVLIDGERQEIRAFRRLCRRLCHVWRGARPAVLHLGVESDFAPARKAHPALRVDDLDALAKRLTDAGFELAWDGNIPGTRRFHVFDPLGNRLEFIAGNEG